MNREYPKLTVIKDILKNNSREIIRRCACAGIDVAVVIKGCSGMPEVAKVISDGAVQIGTSRLEQIENCRRQGLDGPFMLLRVPMISELEELVRLADYSLQSEASVLAALNERCCSQNKRHKVVLMADLGDIREGVWDEDELVELCLSTERELEYVELAGIGTNLGCIGAVKPTKEKLEKLVSIAARVESLIGRRLEIVSGGATTSYVLVHNGQMPAGINHLRIGEGLLLANDYKQQWGIEDMNYLECGAFRVTAQVLEVKTKPSYPQGEIFIDAFGRKPTFIDRGLRRRALVGLGNADVGDAATLIPVDEGVEIVGASSDHIVLDVDSCQRELVPGSTLCFNMTYRNMLFLTCAQGVNIEYV